MSATGNETVDFPFPQDGQYSLCMEEIRNNENGTQCFPGQGPIEYCETFLITCPIRGPLDSLPELELSQNLFNQGKRYGNSLQLFPNPSRHQIGVISNWQGSYKIQILNPNGLIVSQHSAQLAAKQPYNIDIEHLQDGLYLLLVISKHGETLQGRFVKMNQ